MKIDGEPHGPNAVAADVMATSGINSTMAALLNSQPVGFYAPAQLVRDFREHGVEIRAVSVNHSEWDCTLEPRGGGALALRLGSRQNARVLDNQAADRQAVTIGLQLPISIRRLLSEEAPSTRSAMREKPRHMTVVPGGGSETRSR